MAKPDIVEVLTSVLGAVGYLSRYVPDYVALVKPLREMYDITHKWTPRRTKAFAGRKAALCSAPVLAPPDFDEQWVVLTDCSGTTMGAVLAQKDSDGVERPVAYASCIPEGVPHPFRHHIPPEARFERKHQEVAEAFKSRRKH